MTDAREQATETARLVQERLVEALNVVINLLDAENLGEVHEEAAEGDDGPQNGVRDGEDPPDGRVLRGRDAPQRPFLNERPTADQLLRAGRRKFHI